MNQQNRTRIQALCTDLRADSWPTWDAAGTGAAILELSKRMPNDPLGVAVRALTAARNPANRGPATMLHEPQPEAVVRALPTPPSRDDPECSTHHSNIVDASGRFVCCVQEAATPKPVRPVAAPLRAASPCPAEARELIEASIGPRRRAREQAQEMKEQANG